MKTKITLTKKDCIVVFICSVFLLTALGATGAASRERARRMVCKANLYQWFIAIQGYVDDNDGTLMASTAWGFTNGKATSVYPNEMFLDSWASTKGTGTGPDMFAGQFENPAIFFSQEAMTHYLPGFNDQKRRRVNVIADGIINKDSPGAEDLRLGGIWSCPSHNLDTLNDTIGRIRETKGYLRLQNAYFARSELWAGSIATHPKDFGRTDMSSRHLLMADALFLWSSGDFWIYNHGKFGASDHDLGDTYPQPIEAMTGINKMYGDGHAEWKDDSDFDPELLTNPLGAEPRINAGFGAFMYY